MGTMEENLQQGELYPNVEKNLARYSKWLEQIDTVFLSIRSLSDWWASVIAFCVARDHSLPCDQTLNGIVDSPRGWRDVLADVKQAFPHAQIVVREFEWKSDNPKRQLKHVTKWNEWDQTLAIKKPHNKRSTVDTIAVALASREDFDSLSRLPSSDAIQPFTESQIQALDKRYNADLAAISNDPAVQFLGGRELSHSSKGMTFMASETDNDGPSKPLCFLHIGKTGGTFLKSATSKRDVKEQNLYMGKHGDTLISTMKDFGRYRKLGFFFRNPEERFVSGFQSRLRRGLPTYNVDWTQGEAIAFSFFGTPNELAEALSSDDQRLVSAASFAFQHIFHLKLGYQHYLSSTDAVFYEHKMKNIEICCETKNIDAQLLRIYEKLDVSVTSTQEGNRNAVAEEQREKLSPTAKGNLRDYWKTEFEIYEACKIVANDLNFSD
ncbi:MAG: hypothetical protein ABJH45_21225 [Paracoccaceae bacterium]|uniref:hypothetical protein n=1 Tax=Roseibium sp. TaxID=1936156 RepID=UPI00326B5755